MEIDGSAEIRSRRRPRGVTGVATGPTTASGRPLPLGDGAGMLRAWAVDKGPPFLYIALITLLFTTFGTAARALRVFAAPGRMALTSYLTQTVVLTLLFVPYGLGLTSLTTTAQLLFNLAFFFLLQVPVSHWWAPLSSAPAP